MTFIRNRTGLRRGHPRRGHPRRGRAGIVLDLVNATFVLIISTVVIGGIIALYFYVTGIADKAQQDQLVTAIDQTMKATYAGQAGYGSADDDNLSPGLAAQMPNSLVTTSAAGKDVIRTPYGGKVEIYSGGDVYTVVFKDIDGAICKATLDNFIGLSTRRTGLERVGVRANASVGTDGKVTAVKADDEDAGYTKAKMDKLCDKADASTPKDDLFLVRR